MPGDMDIKVLTNLKFLTRTIWILSLISLFTDIASEMLYPIMPVYLKSIGFSVALIGILEGIAEATAGLSKGYFGKLSDERARRAPFIQLGYLLSTLSKPMMAAFVYPVWIFFARTTDRLGKGIRTAARDAMLSDEANPETKGKVFGFHRSMDTLGATIGPILALVYLHFYPEDYINLFLIAFVPGIIATAFSLLLKDKKPETPAAKGRVSFLSFIKYWKTSTPTYRRLLVGLLLFTLFNSSDVFLLLKVKQAGFDDTTVISVYIFYNLIYALAAYPMGIFADKWGLKNIFIAGLILFSAVYFGMSVTNDIYVFYGLFFLYGLYAAATEGISKAWISNISEKKDTATAIGTYTAFQSICTMLASSLAGLIWYLSGPGPTFMLTGAVALLLSVYFFRFRNNFK